MFGSTYLSGWIRFSSKLAFENLSGLDRGLTQFMDGGERVI